MSSKLRNIEAVGKLLQGNHKTQNRTVVSFAGTESAADKSKRREVGEVWFETNPVTGHVFRWEQKEGYRSRESVTARILKQARDSLFSKCFDDCEKKKNSSYGAGDKKAALKTNMCIDCLAKFETSIRYKGREEFEKYAREKMKANAQSFFKNADEEVDLIKKQLKEELAYVTVDGHEEKWTPDKMDDLIERVDKEYAQFKTNILNNL